MKYTIVCFLIIVFSCTNISNQRNQTSDQKEVNTEGLLSINLSHFKHLYKDVKLPNGKDAAIVHIYSNYPDYNYDIEPKEGFTCVDDVARAIVMLSKINGETESIIRLSEFLLYMQNENGWFNNFIWKDLSINTSYQTSIAEPNWWSWRALWAMEKALPIIEKQDVELAERTTLAIQRLVANTRAYISGLQQIEKRVEGIPIATNLPFESATDQASILLIGLYYYYQRTKDPLLEKLMRQLANGLIKMQIQEGELQGMFLSWENLWHAYGNTQSYALLLTGKLFRDENYVQAALKEINSFYPYLYQNNFPELMTFKMEDGEAAVIESKPFPQIAYGIRPIVYACVEAYHQTGEEKYRAYAEQWLSWFLGNNIARKEMYDSTTGRCYDGIKSADAINQNSGAESTIEALLSIQAYQSIN